MTDPVTVNVLIQGSYQVDPDRAQEVYGSSEPASIAAIDQKQYDDGEVGVDDVVSWLHSDTIKISVSASATPDEDNQIFAHHLLRALVEFNFGDYGLGDLPVLEDGQPTEVIQDLAKTVLGEVSGYFATRAQEFDQAPEEDTTSHVIARVLKHLAGEMAILPGT